MKKLFILILCAVVLLVCVMLLKTVAFTRKPVEKEPFAGIEADPERAAVNLSRAIRFKTVSHQEPSKFDSATFEAFHLFLEKTFPKAHGVLQREVINGYSLLYAWKGTDEFLKPVILMAHMDVVPISDDREPKWTSPPFEGRIADGFIWGRGSLDDKVSLMGIMEAVELLLADGFKPRRTLYLAFGHDEEIGGLGGAARIAAFLKSKMVKSDWILDEGGVITNGVVPGVKKPVAAVGIAEKGYMTLELRVKHEGGHSSMPPKDNAICILCNAINNLEKNQFQAKFDGATLLFFNTVGPEMPFYLKFLFANEWLFSPLIKNRLEKSKVMNAMTRTTFVPTIIEAGTKENVLPQIATAKVNFRPYPGDSTEYVIEHVKKAIDDPRVHVLPSKRFRNEASSISDAHSKSFMVIERSIQQAFPDVIAAPFLLVAGTDAKHYCEISENIFRFLPVRMSSEDLKRVHGTDERIGKENYAEVIQFYIRLIRNSN